MSEYEGADFSRAMAHLNAGIVEHADRDGLRGVARAVFIDRGGHAPGDLCPTAVPADPHRYWCLYPDDECSCGGAELSTEVPPRKVETDGA